jgi:hypothetical protein
MLCADTDAARYEPAWDAAAKTFRTEQIVASGSMANDGRWVEKEGGFSWLPPPGWRLRLQAESYYKGALRPPERGVTPTVSVADCPGSEPLKQFVARFYGGLMKGDQTLRPLFQKELATDSALAGLKSVYERLDPKSREKRYYTDYFFEVSPGRKIRMQCVCAAEEGKQLDSVFDACAKTFRLERTETPVRP